MAPSSFSALKKNSKNQIAKLTEQVNKLNQTNQNQDDRQWFPDTDKAGNGKAIVRFLPAPEGEDVPFVRLFQHAFRGPKGWYIENCLTTLGQTCPCCEYNSTLWNSTQDKEAPARKQVSKQKRNQLFISNVLVIKDTQHPENEGKVKLFKFGKKIFDKLTAAMQEEDEAERIDPFNMWEDGANFTISIRKVDDRRNYDNSKFGSKGAMFPEDAKIEAIWKQTYQLQPFLAADQFKNYDDLKARLHKVLELSEGKKVQPVAVKDPWDETPMKPNFSGDNTDEGDTKEWFQTLTNDIN